MNLEETIELARKIAGEKGANKNPMDGSSCIYTDAEGNHCFVGEILAGIGFPLPELGNRHNTVGVKQLLIHTAIFSKDALDFLQDLQNKADFGMEWREAFETVMSPGFRSFSSWKHKMNLA